MKIIIVLLVVLLVFLQYKLWFTNGGVAKALRLRHAVAVQTRHNDELKKSNQRLKTDIANLKRAGGAIEEHARNDLGMIKDGEVFYRVVDTSKQDKQQKQNQDS